MGLTFIDWCIVGILVVDAAGLYLAWRSYRLYEDYFEERTHWRKQKRVQRERDKEPGNAAQGTRT